MSPLKTKQSLVIDLCDVPAEAPAPLPVYTTFPESQGIQIIFLAYFGVGIGCLKLHG